MFRLLHAYDSLMNTGSPMAKDVLTRLDAQLDDHPFSSSVKMRVYAATCRWYVERGDCDSAKYFAQLAWMASANNHDRMRAALAIGAAQRCAGYPDSSLAAYFLAERIAFAAHDTFVLMRSWFYIGHVHSELGKFEKAAADYRLSQSFAKQTHNAEFIARTSLALASNLADQGLVREALPALQLALQQCKKAGLVRQEATACNNLGMLCKELRMYRQALQYFRSSLEIQARLGNQYEMATEYNNLAIVQMLLGHYREAIPLLQQAETLSAELEGHPVLTEVYHNLAICYAETGDYRNAYVYKNEHKNLDDSLRGMEMLKHTEQLQEEFEAEKRQMEISGLKQENEVKELKNKVHLKQRDIFIGLAGGLFCISLLVYFILRQKIANARQVSEKDRQIHRQQLEEVMRSSELQSIHTMVETQEKERRRIAEDLHDRVGSMLSAVRLRFSGLVPKYETAVKEQGEYEQLARLIDQTCEEIRMVSHNLVSGVLDTFGLVPALFDLREALSSSGLEMSIHSHGMDARVPREVEINLYRIIQELLNNTIRHAGATRVDIEISRVREELTMIYSDNGRGFDTAKNNTGIGLKNIQSRTDKLEGTLHIDSGKGNGSTFVLTINLL